MKRQRALLAGAAAVAGLGWLSALAWAWLVRARPSPEPVQGQSAPAVAASPAIVEQETGRKAVATRGVRRASLQVEVTDEYGRGIVGARVYAYSETQRELLGRTAGAGSLDTRVVAGRTTLLAEKEGFASARAYVCSPAPEAVRLQLTRELVLEGRVLSAADRKPLAGVTVVAVPDDVPADRHLMRLSATGQPVLPTAVSDEDGRFRLSALDPGTRHRLEAGGSGFILPEAHRVEAAPGGPLELLMWRLYGVRVSTVAAGGGRPPVASIVGVESCTQLSCESSAECAPIARTSWSLALDDAAWDALRSLAEYDLYQDVLLYSSPAALDRLGPIRLIKCVPGYETVNAEFWARPIAGGLASEELVVSPVWDRYGALEVRLTGLPSPEIQHHTARGPMEYAFLRHRELDVTMMFPVDPAVPSRSLGLVPTGTYQVALRHRAWQSPDWSRPLAEFEVGEGSNLTSIDLSSQGGFEVRLVGVGGARAEGPVEFELLAAGEPAILDHYSFDHAPYRVWGLESGSYSLAVHRRYAPSSDHAHSAEFFVSAGVATSVVCSPAGPDQR